MQNQSITATFEVVTPMYLGGADQRATQIRPASVKGALRFWWRALNWAQYAQADEATALRKLHQRECELFGQSATPNGGGGQGVFMMQVVPQPGGRLAVDPWYGQAAEPGIAYLLGMGLTNGQRNALPASQAGRPSFELRLLFRPQTPAADVKSVAEAVQLFGLLGALGSRARHGMGSVAMTGWQAGDQLALPAWKPPVDLDTYCQSLAHLRARGRQATALPPFSAFYESTRVEVSKQGSDMLKLLDSVGREQQAYRSFGLNGEVNGKKSEKNFQSDHDLMRQALMGEPVKAAPKRAVFGLPHNYFFSSANGGKVDLNYETSSSNGQKEAGRRASPLLLHIHRLGHMHVAVHTLFQARFLPADGQDGSSTLTARPQRRPKATMRMNADWQVIHTYLDRYKQQPGNEWRAV